MRIKPCLKCKKDTYHYVWLTYRSEGVEVVTTICAVDVYGKDGCYNAETFIVPIGTWFKTITGG